MLHEEKENLPKFKEKGEIISYDKVNFDKLALALGLNASFVYSVQEGLAELKKAGINRSILTVLKINKAAVILHEACINKSDYNDYKAIFKPLFIKKKTANNSIKSGFIEPFSEEEHKKFKEKYATLIKDNINREIEIGEADLKFPLAHLQKLASPQINDIELLSLSGNYLTVKETKGQQGTYKILVPDISNENITPKDFFTSEYFKNNCRKIVNVCEDDETTPVKVLGVKTPETNEEFHPVIADVDAHTLGIKTSKKQILRDTAQEAERDELKNDIANLLENTSLIDKIESYQKLIHPLMGKISAEEHIAYLVINEKCNRDIGIYAIFQHGATTNMQHKEVKEARDEGAPYFPAVEDNTLIASILSHQERVLHVEGKYILPFYAILINEGGYNMELQYLWKQQLRELEKDNNIEEIRRKIRRNLLEVGITLNQTSYQNAAISLVVSGVTTVAVGTLLYSKNQTLFGGKFSSRTDNILSGVLAGTITGAATYVALNNQAQTDDNENNKKNWSCNIL